MERVGVQLKRTSPVRNGEVWKNYWANLLKNVRGEPHEGHK
jgi:hypothetical protein